MAYLQPFYRQSAVSALALSGGLFCGAAVYVWAPAADPVGVVGVPLVAGYSEASEQWSYYAFVAVTIALGAILQRLSNYLPGRMLGVAGALLLMAALAAPFWAWHPIGLPAATFCAAIAYWAGRYRPTAESARSIRGEALATAACLLWAVGFSDIALTLLQYWVFLLAALAGAVSIQFLSRWLPGRWRGRQHSPIWLLAALIVVAGTWSENSHQRWLGLMGAVAFWMGAAASGAGFEAPNWLIVIAAMSLLPMVRGGWITLGEIRPALLVLGGAAGAAVVTKALREAGLILALPQKAIPALTRSLPWLAAAGILATAIDRPWFGAIAGLLAFSVLAYGPIRGRKSHAGVLLAILLFLSLLPTPPIAGVDHFHDGQILSAVWEFETGRALYSDVFPLRGFDFFVAWLARRFLPDTFATYQLGQQLFTYLPVAGACLITFFWTRSLPWSFATGLAACWLSVMDGRSGVHLLLGAAAVYGLKDGSWSGWAWVALGGWLSAFAGYDVFVPYSAGALAGLAVSQPNGSSGIRRYFGQAAVRGSGALVALTAPFSVFVACWQGWPSAVAYWSLLQDNARHLPSFYGLPLPWHDASLRSLMIAALVIVGLFGGTLAARLPCLPFRTRGAATFLLLQTVLIMLRGVGRSDDAHLQSLVHPSIVLGSIGIYESVRWIRRLGYRSIFSDVRVLAAVASLAACWLTPHGRLNPGQFLASLRVSPNRGDAALAPSMSIVQETAANEYVWDLENATLNYRYRRHNPTRHALAYCISSPMEQREAVRALAERPPKVIAWNFRAGSNGITNPLRFYVISQFLYERYKPGADEWFLEPAGADWPGTVDLPENSSGVMRMGHLPMRWGKARLDELRERRMDHQPSGDWNVLDDGQPVGSFHPASDSARECRGSVASRRFNYLIMQFSCRADLSKKTSHTEASLLFAPTGRDYDHISEITFRIVPDGVARTYAIPIGCSAGWSWRPEIDRLCLVASGAQLGPVQAEFWRVDELRD